MRIMQISAAPPCAPDDGSTATFATLRAVCQAGHQVTYAYIPRTPDDENGEPAARLLADCGGNLTLLPLRGARTAMDEATQKLRASLRACRRCGPGLLPGLIGHPATTLTRGRRMASMLRGLHRWMLARIEWALSVCPHDVVQVDYARMIGLAAALPTAVPKLFVAHEVISEVTEQLRPANAKFQRLIESCEGELLGRYDAVAALSEENADTLRRRFGLPRVHCSPLAIDCSRRRPALAELAEGGHVRFSFLGSQGHQPNADAVRWLCREIVPRLRRVLPRMKLKIVGRYHRSFVRAFSADDIRFVGFLDNFDDLLARSIFLCPVRLGSGMRIKILDAVLAGAAVISTGVGAHGLGLVPERHYLQADTPDEFAAQAQRLAGDEWFRRWLANTAQRHVVERFSPQAAGGNRIALLENLVHRRDVSPRRSAKAA